MRDFYSAAHKQKRFKKIILVFLLLAGAFILPLGGASLLDQESAPRVQAVSNSSRLQGFVEECVSNGERKVFCECMAVSMDRQLSDAEYAKLRSGSTKQSMQYYETIGQITRSCKEGLAMQ